MSALHGDVGAGPVRDSDVSSDPEATHLVESAASRPHVAREESVGQIFLPGDFAVRPIESHASRCRDERHRFVSL